VNNLFKQHAFDVSALLNSDGTNNTLVIAFQNALDYALKSSEAYPYDVPLTSYYNTWSEPSNRNFIRKTNNDFGKKIIFEKKKT
jgi:hypothetical protein